MVLPQVLSSLGGQAAPPVPPLPHKPTPLVLHMDINECILIGDEAGGDTREESLNKSLAKSAFVRLPPGVTSLEDTHSIEPTHWWDGTPILGGSDDSVPAPLYTGWQWPPGCAPYYRTAYKKLAKDFVNGHGRPFKPLYDEMEGILSFSHPEMPNVMSHILPALFRTLEELTRRGEPFHLVLRSFGSDVTEVAEAISIFARGQHPNYPEFHNDNLVVSEGDLVIGRWNTKSGAFELFSHDDKLVASGDEEILDWIQERTICGIQDDYKYWSQHECQPWAGKPVWAPARSRRQHHVLFDDNIHNLVTDSIACVRVQSHSGSPFKSLSGEDTQKMQGLHLIRVPTIEPILNPDWFLQQIDRARARYAADAESDNQR